MAPRATSAALNIQPRQRRDVYHALGKVSAGRSVKDLLADVDMPEHDLRESLRVSSRSRTARPYADPRAFEERARLPA
jgi:hypothetical protein